jgi:hypothetical protein
VRLAALLAFNLAGDGIPVVVDRGIDRDVDIGAAVAFLADDEEFLGQLVVHRFHITDSALIVKARAAPYKIIGGPLIGPNRRETV